VWLSILLVWPLRSYEVLQPVFAAVSVSSSIVDIRSIPLGPICVRYQPVGPMWIGECPRASHFTSAGWCIPVTFCNAWGSRVPIPSAVQPQPNRKMKFGTRPHPRHVKRNIVRVIFLWPPVNRVLLPVFKRKGTWLRFCLPLSSVASTTLNGCKYIPSLSQTVYDAHRDPTSTNLILKAFLVGPPWRRSLMIH
jgi:hypothetical protein